MVIITREQLITLHIGRGLALYRPAIRFSAFLSWVNPAGEKPVEGTT